MPNFIIFQEDPYKYKSEIIRFWEEYLPGTPAERLDWLKNNPAGPTIWLFAVDETTGALAGTISLFPKNLFYDNKQIRAAILGDFMIHWKYRVFGPALNLLKSARSFKDNGDFDFLYTIPNSQSKKIIEKAGFKSSGKIYSLMNPQQYDFFLKKYIGSFAIGILDKPLSFIMKLFSLATFIGPPGVFQEIDWNDDAFNKFCQQLRKRQISLMTAYCSLVYLDWRHRQNPEYDCQIYTCRKKSGGDIQGFFVISEKNQRLELYDLVALDNKFIMTMIRKISSIARQKKCRGVYSLIYQNNPMLAYFRKCCFFDTKDQIEIYTYSEEIKETKSWSFAAADRNI